LPHRTRPHTLASVSGGRPASALVRHNVTKQCCNLDLSRATDQSIARLRSLSHQFSWAVELREGETNTFGGTKAQVRRSRCILDFVLCDRYGRLSGGRPPAHSNPLGQPASAIARQPRRFRNEIRRPTGRYDPPTVMKNGPCSTGFRYRRTVPKMHGGSGRLAADRSRVCTRVRDSGPARVSG
jgi:hypothetical protein